MRDVILPFPAPRDRLTNGRRGVRRATSNSKSRLIRAARLRRLEIRLTRRSSRSHVQVTHAPKTAAPALFSAAVIGSFIPFIAASADPGAARTNSDVTGTVAGQRSGQPLASPK